MALRRAFETVEEGLTVLEYVATHLNCLVIPETFVPEFDPAPEEPDSLDTMFGASSEYEYKDLFVNHYDQVSNTWNTESLEIVPEVVREDVADQLILINEYTTDYANWKMEYDVARAVQWRVLYANRLITACEE